MRHMASFTLGRRTQLRDFHSTTGSRRTRYMVPQVGQEPSTPLHRLLVRSRESAHDLSAEGLRTSSPDGETTNLP